MKIKDAFLIFGQRLKEARELRGLNQAELAERLQVSRQIVSDYESGKKKPSGQTLFSLTRELDLPWAFFMTERKTPERVSPFSFRKKSSTTKREQLQAKQQERLLVDIVKYLEGFLDLPKANVLMFEGDDYQDLDIQTIESLAQALRKHWNLGNGPISNMVRLMETNGIIVSKVSIADRIDAFSCWIEERPIAILSQEKQAAVRQRFDAAHELGHIVMHRYIPEKYFQDKTTLKVLEDQAQYFGSAFLLPADTFPKEVLVPSVQGFTMLKSRWKTSIQAMIMRCHALRLISDNQKKYLFQQMAKFRKFEPLDDQLPQEEPQLIAKAFEVLLDAGLIGSMQDVQEALCLSAGLIQEIGGLPSSLFQRESEQPLAFRLKSPSE